MLNNFWKRKKVLVTGNHGFVGTHLTKALSKVGASVYEKAVDVVDTQAIFRLFKNHRFDYCFHLAAQSLVEGGKENPLSTFEVNVKGTWNILEASRKFQVKGLLIASTAHIYGNNPLPYKEIQHVSATRPYESSKAAADILAQMYDNYYHMPIIITRCVNIYGPGDRNKRLIPNTIRSFLHNRRPQEFTTNTIRDYIYVDDVVNAYILLVEYINRIKKSRLSAIFNIGTGKHYSNSYIIQKIITLMHKNIRPHKIKNRQQEIAKQYVSIDKIQKAIGWHPKNDLETGLKKTIQWYEQTFF